MNDYKKIGFKIIGISYILVLIYLLFFAYFRQGPIVDINLIPFKSIIAFCVDFQLPHWWYWTVNVPGNIVAFIPIPFILYNLSGIKINSSTLKSKSN